MCETRKCTLSKKSQIQKPHMTPFIENIPNRKIHRDSIQAGDCQNREGEEWEATL